MTWATTTATATATATVPLAARQIVDNTPASSSSLSSDPATLGPYTLLSGGVISINPTQTITLTDKALFQPASAEGYTLNGSDSCIYKFQTEPFFASSTPLIYVVATTTVIAWTLLIIILITPRTFSIFSPSRASGLIPGRSLLTALSGRSSLFASGSRPWLQTAAALSVAISMTVATADTFKEAERQYHEGTQNADTLRDNVSYTTVIQIFRVISDLILWLAQVQTLIRLFPRHKEKLLIKWIGFFLIFADIVFSCLTSFWINRSKKRPLTNRDDAIPALSYLFQLALSLLYATWVLYYALTKRQYAFYHERMPNICIIALLSCVSISIPVAFFIADILEAGIAGWGDYFRWVGAAAASIVVWEWVERIEAVEREEKKDGILGREVFDGDDMLNTTPSDSHDPRLSLQSHSDAQGGRPTGVLAGFRKLVNLKPPRRSRDVEARVIKMNGNLKSGARRPTSASTTSSGLGGHKDQDALALDGQAEEPETPPPTTHTPVDRSNAASAESTVYAVRYHPVSDTPPVPPLRHSTATNPAAAAADAPLGGTENGEAERQSSDARGRPSQTVARHSKRPSAKDPSLSSRQRSSINSATHRRAPFGRMGHFAVNTFRRSRRSPPLEVKNAMSLDKIATDGIAGAVSVPKPDSSSGLAKQQAPQQRTGFMARLGVGGGGGGGGSSSRGTSVNGTDRVQPKVIPAPPRGQTWSPHDARHSPMDTIFSGGTPAAGTSSAAAATAGTEADVPPSPSRTRSDHASSEAGGGSRRSRPSSGLGQQSSTTNVQHFPHPRTDSATERAQPANVDRQDTVSSRRDVPDAD